MIWATPQAPGIYNIAFLIREYRNGVLLSTIIRDMQIIVNDCNDNDPPRIKPLVDTCVYACDTLDITIRATDPDFGDRVDLFAYGGPLEISTNPATFTAVSGNPALGAFYWITDCEHIRSQFYTVIFKAQDDYVDGTGTPIPLTDLETYTIKVVAPPPENLSVTTSGRDATLTWDNPYKCESSSKFRGFSVWRKIGCDTSGLSSCETNLSLSGFVRIASGLTTYSYLDNTLSPGNKYTYRVQADFAESTPAGTDYESFTSAPSNPVCVELKKDLPLLTHVTVDSTDLSTGMITIAWVKADPDELDTTLNEAPYRYELINETTSTTVTSLVTPVFGFSDDSMGVQETGLNTEQVQFNYRLNFYATVGGTEELVGSTVTASSVFLTTTGNDNRITLDWTASVPWLNEEYYVYKENPVASGIFVVIDTTTELTYTDTGLTNEQEYCYRIESFGGYTSEGAPDSLYNFSQKSCTEPVDSTRPCAPLLTVTNVCDEDSDASFDLEDLKNNLTWTNPNRMCSGTDDVVAYEILFAAQNSGTYQLIATISDQFDTFYVHDDLNSLAGCYAIRSIDSFGNKSTFSNVVCVDNCPQFDLPNVFTPNGDGANDLYTPFPPHLFIDRIDFKVFNDWGGLVFETSDPAINWDGTNLQGKALAEGVYYYVCDVYEIRVNGVVPRKEVLSGFIHIIRGK